MILPYAYNEGGVDLPRAKAEVFNELGKMSEVII